MEELIKDLSNVEPKLICEKCYEAKNEKIMLGLSPTQYKNNDLCTVNSLQELKSGLFLITEYLYNYELIPYKKEIFESKIDEIKTMMGYNYANNINKVNNIICCKSKHKHIIGFTKRSLDPDKKDNYSYISPSSPVLIAFYPTKVVMPFKKEIFIAFKQYLIHINLRTPLIKNPNYNIAKIYDDNMDSVINEFKRRTKCVLCNFVATDEINGYISDKRMLLQELNQKLLDHLKSAEHILNTQKLFNEDLFAV